MDPQFDEVRALVFEPYTLFRVRPMRGRFVNVAEQGYRLGDPSAIWPPEADRVNVFVFGGSTAFGYGVTDAETIPSQLAGQLQELQAGAQVSVYNFATPNHVSVQERIRLEQLILSGYRPAIAVFLDGFGEFIAPYYEPLMWKRFVNETASVGGILAALGERLHGLLPSRRANGPECQLPNPGAIVARYLRNVRLISAVCVEFAIRPLFVWQPVPCYQYSGQGLVRKHGGSGRLLEGVASVYELMNARRDKDFSGNQFLWLADMQRDRTDSLYVDADHYTPGFSKEIATLIARHLVVHGFVKAT